MVVERARAVEEVGHLLTVGLVLVDPGEARTPVVERVEGPVLAHHPAVAAHHAAVVRGAVGGQVLALGGVRGCGAPARHRPAEQERDPAHGVDGASEEPDLGEPVAGAETRSGARKGAAQPVGPRPRLSDPRQREARSVVVGAVGGQCGQVDRARAGEDRRHPCLVADEARVGHVRVDGDREEVLTAGEADDGLVGPEQAEVLLMRHGVHLSPRSAEPTTRRPWVGTGPAASLSPDPAGRRGLPRVRAVSRGSVGGERD